MGWDVNFWFTHSHAHFPLGTVQGSQNQIV